MERPRARASETGDRAREARRCRRRARRVARRSLHLYLHAFDRVTLGVLEVRPPVGAKLVALPPPPSRSGALPQLEPHVRDLGVVAVGELAIRIVIGDA